MAAAASFWLGKFHELSPFFSFQNEQIAIWIDFRFDWNFFDARKKMSKTRTSARAHTSSIKHKNRTRGVI